MYVTLWRGERGDLIPNSSLTIMWVPKRITIYLYDFITTLCMCHKPLTLSDNMVLCVTVKHDVQVAFLFFRSKKVLNFTYKS
jgi:hypothetical protein